MRPSFLAACRLMLRALGVLLLATTGWLSAHGQALPGSQAKAPAQQVVVGVYINDIQAIDMRAHSYVVDLYVWFRWTDRARNPAARMEFMNLADPDAHTHTPLYDAPKAQPDGSRYQVIRHQGAFSTKFPLGRYPFDQQELRINLEDSEFGADEQIYVPDMVPVTLNPAITLPGYKLTGARIEITQKAYPTTFGDLAEPDTGAYSRASIAIGLQRPVLSGTVKVFLPVLLIILCAALALLLDPVHLDARIGLSITALLTLVALQFTASANLPDVDYLTLLDQIYLASYLYILAVIAMVVRDTRIDQTGQLQASEASPARGWSGPVAALGLTGAYLAVCAALLVVNLRA